MPRVIAVTSGKGGVGKSNFVLNVGIALAMMDNKVQLLDADLGLANLDVLLGVRTDYSLEDVVMGQASIEDIILKTDYKVELIPGSSGMEYMADLPGERVNRLIKSVMNASKDADFLIVDTASGISSSVISFLMAVPEVIVGVNTEPTSLTDAYALIKVLKKNGFSGRISMFSSMAKDSSSGRLIYKKISSAAHRFLGSRVDYIGSVCTDAKLLKAVSAQVPVIVKFPTSDIARCYRGIATTLVGEKLPLVDFERFWERTIRIMLKKPRAKSYRAVSFNGESRVKELESAINGILSEQRRTRLLLERFMLKMEQAVAETEAQKGPVV
ncbi:MAG: MinD/ParA family protein [Thermodesulfobacteriota bacterium]|nr:MinD/ParA family protein [Thermodesulfobacteriota bacterium]